MIPVYTRVLTPADYGIIETIVRIVDIISLFLALGLAEALLRHYYIAKDEDDRKRLVGTVFTLNLAVVAVGSLLVLPFSSYLAEMAFGHHRYAHYVAVALIGMLVGNLIEIPLTLWRAEGKAWRFTTVSLMKLTTQLTTNIVLVVWLRWGVWGVVLSGLINAVVWSAVLAVVVRRQYGLCWDLQWIKPVLQYGLPLVPAALSQFVLHFSDRFFLTRYATESELGLYSLAYRFGMLVSVFFGIISRAWWPWVFRVAEDENSSALLRRGSAFILLAGAVFCAGVILGSSPVIRLVAAPPFWKAAEFVPLLAMSYWFFISSSALRIGSLIGNQTMSFAKANLLSAIACLALNAWLISHYSTWGAVYATFGSFVIFSLSVWISAQRIHPIAHDTTAFALAIGVMLISTWLDSHLHLVLWADALVRFVLWVLLSSVIVVYFVHSHQIRLPLVRVRTRGREA
ncbi:MAG: oligosaccharide flippase family protein [Chthonomonadetes bacterium]|nr:oligosaccharide flippase family protein [Chthonomonadetes bacterium]